MLAVTNTKPYCPILPQISLLARQPRAELWGNHHKRTPTTQFTPWPKQRLLNPVCEPCARSPVLSLCILCIAVYECGELVANAAQLYRHLRFQGLVLFLRFSSGFSSAAAFPSVHVGGDVPVEEGETVIEGSVEIARVFSISSDRFPVVVIIFTRDLTEASSRVLKEAARDALKKKEIVEGVGWLAPCGTPWLSVTWV